MCWRTGMPLPLLFHCKPAPWHSSGSCQLTCSQTMAGHGSGDSAGHGLLPRDRLNEATLFRENENSAIWTWGMLCLLAPGQDNHCTFLPPYRKRLEPAEGPPRDGARHCSLSQGGLGCTPAHHKAGTEENSLRSGKPLAKDSTGSRRWAAFNLRDCCNWGMLQLILRLYQVPLKLTWCHRVTVHSKQLYLHSKQLSTESSPTK